MIKTIIKNTIYFLIQLIEKYEFRNFNPDDEDLLKKFTNTIFLKNDLYVETDYGQVPVSEINITQPFQRYRLELENGLWFEGADTHILFCEDYSQKMLIDLTINDVILTKQGPSRVKRVSKIYGKTSMFDLTIDTPEMSYYTNDILSHNTVSAAIVILHFVLFNDEKGCMIVANKGKTVKEIIKKIKDIYKLLPFFLKKGVINWNETQIAFENNSRIQTENRTKDPSIGFTIDLLYLDEFAHIPNNYVADYYSAIVPVVSAVENSRIIITSTPKGFNMFYDLLMGAEKDENDPLKNPYKAMRVYWYQVEGRQDTQLRLLDGKLKKYGMAKSTVLRELRDQGITFYKKHKGDDVIDCVKYDSDDEKTHIKSIRQMRVGGLPLPELGVVTNWQEEETKLINGEDRFKQEYDLFFVTGDRLLFDKETMDSLKKREIPFDHIQFPLFDQKLRFPYTSLEFIRDKTLFDKNQTKKYYILMSIDLAEGLAKDFTVINIFRLVMRDKDDIAKHKYESVYDLFKIEQIGLFRNNLYSIREVADIFYLLAFEMFDPEKVKVILEYNTYGAEFLAHLPHVFDDCNDYFSAVFIRTVHSSQQVKVTGQKSPNDYKIGLRLNRDKHLIIDKEFQQSIKKRKIVIHNDINISEINTFAKYETSAGNVSYRAESGHDDVVMSTITLSTVFDTVAYKNMIDMFINNELDVESKKLLESFSDNSKGSSKLNDFVSTYGKVYAPKGPPENIFGLRYPSPRRN